MRLNLGTIEVDDTFRHALRWRYGRNGKATRDEIRRFFVSAGEGEAEALVHEYRNNLEAG